MTKGGGNWIPACAGMIDKALFIRVLEILNYPFRNALKTHGKCLF